MKYCIIQVCCFDCNHFENVFFTDDYISTIASLDNHTDYMYYIYNLDGDLLFKYSCF